ncbi:ribose transport system permease protein [Homoserinimonas aerilata]|uniref:Ribose transport system permease protein n=1 Tax=Homoserinimonas aerilata TaxID=1162970 RepID=A0A542YL94_9MICO|nr:ABC transporter permease [Homoserinimonas aerilata]TQL48853.1 ribose transport system permease protein [Homoserinimonas aerilata]
MGTVAKWAPVLALIALVIVGAITSPIFLSSGNIRSILLASAIMMILAIGQTFVISTAGIDLSVASIAQLSGVALGVVVSWGFAPELGMLGAIVVGALAGALNGFIVSRWKITDFVATLGTFSAFTGLTLLISDARPQLVTSKTLITISTGGLGFLSNMLIIALVVAAIAYVIMFHTRFGTHVLAVGGNRKASDALGISFTKVKIGVYTISGILAGVAGILLVARLGAAEPTAGSAYQLTSIAAAVLGGVSLFGGKTSIIGPLIGAIVLTGIVNLLTITGVPVYYQPIAVGAVVVLAAYLRKYEN